MVVNTIRQVRKYWYRMRISDTVVQLHCCAQTYQETIIHLQIPTTYVLTAEAVQRPHS